ncbi:hypothetical protein Pmar_PMAR027270 [Perkinsus marinus ATCC 50983]|uniref:Uncharacterized protein n=1 Tax=Perkinsus marinus (strain ATCC 50983 / TXsc) TaxID=423536 RepID=C5LX07_PERM5|nr:hypothetical protein Pmar_PMAR027270 [Perkinsus marinus ATCC 50983]EEQ98785.1 hypothetical protein Pmar_PMAR027270 [Perkinsus marinus ATCC 50983]|eukprot:XP_002766068.1 hypothetical protein Pmar_PMAR027270 [Perkinsus marinus ATCC 50983]
MNPTISRLVVSVALLNVVWCEAYFPPHEYYCSKEALRHGFEFGLRFPRKPEWFRDTFGVLEFGNVVVYGIPYKKFEKGEKLFVAPRMNSIHFVPTAKSQNWTVENWKHIPYDNDTDSITIQPRKGGKVFTLSPNNCPIR